MFVGEREGVPWPRHLQQGKFWKRSVLIIQIVHLIKPSHQATVGSWVEQKLLTFEDNIAIQFGLFVAKCRNWNLGTPWMSYTLQKNNSNWWCVRHWRRSDCISCWATSVNFVEVPPIRVLVFCQIYFGQVWVSEYMYYFVRKIINFFVTHLHVMWTDRSWVYIVVFKFPKQIKNCKHQCYMDIDDVLVQQMNFQQICFNCTYI